MKKFISYLLTLSIFLTTAPTSFASSDADDLLKIVGNTVNSSSIAMSEQVKLQYGKKNMLNIDASVKDTSALNQTNVQAAWTVDASEFPKSFQDQMGSVASKLSGKMIVKGEYNKVNDTLAFGLDDFSFETSGLAPEFQAVIDIFSESAKLFFGKSFLIDSKTLTDAQTSSEGFATVMPSKAQTLEVYTQLIKSGLFIVQSQGQGVYTLTLTNDLSTIKAENILALLTAMQADPFVVDAVKEKLSSLTKEEYAVANTALKAIKDNNVVSFKIVTLDNKVNNFQISANFDISKTLKAFSLPVSEEFASLSYEQSVQFSYDALNITSALEAKQTIDLGKIIKAGKVLEEAQAKKFQDNMKTWSEQNTLKDTGVSDMKPQDTEPTAEIEDMLKQVPADAWYSDAMKFLIKEGVIDSVDTTGTLSAQDVYTIVYTGETDDSLSKEPINKLDAVKLLVSWYFPEEKNPVRFAIEKGVVSKAFSPNNAKSSLLTKPELYVMIYRLDQLYAEANKVQNEVNPETLPR